MLCPFSKELCRECTVYRGRHYYICFRKEYRGYIGQKGHVSPFLEGRENPVVFSGKKSR
jgi:hypothetical protein